MNINVIEYLESSAKINPNKIVFADVNESITYSDFVHKAKIVGSYISEMCESKSAKTNQPIMVFIDRTINTLILFFGIIYSGNFYVPCDNHMPIKRIESMKNTLNPLAILAPDDNDYSSEYINLDEITSITKIMDSNTKIDEDLLNEIMSNHIDTDPLYCMFTSGSTGIPKGVLISHRGVIDLVEQFKLTFGFDDTVVFANQAPFDFDVSTKDIYSTIKNGGTMHITNRAMFIDTISLVNFLNERKVNTLIWATSAMKILGIYNTFEEVKPEYLKTVMFSGEVMPVKVLNYWKKYSPKTTFVNVYGPTEITCNCTYYIIEKEFEENDRIPVGKAFRNTEVLLLDDNDNKIIEPNIKGEICVRGSCLALGYYNNLEKTHDVFKTNPLQIYYDENIYHTGDIGMYDENKDIIFVGRNDSQIKHMGNRIELSEIEINVNSLNFIDFGCCLYDEENAKICLFYQAKEQCDSQITVELKKMLPKYMIPNRIVYFEKLPENKNGKIDRVLLKEKYINNNEKIKGNN